MKNSYAKKVDSNQPEIVEALRKAGAVVKHVHTISNFYDILVLFRGRSYHMEVKDGTLIPSRKRLTPGEQKCKEEFESVGVDYHVVESINQALQIIGLKT